jgi:pSer/pThr/pTyr-binding forkhead associated (FHA) protein
LSGGDEDLPAEEEPEPAPPPPTRGKPSLTLVMANREPFKMTGDVVTIGRGKSCEFIIESNRVSREHARIMREAAGFVLEDLQSSNGTFFGPNKEKVTRRPIRDGDEFTFGTEKVKFQVRK